MKPTRLLAIVLGALPLLSIAAPLPLPEMGPTFRRKAGRLSFELLPKAFQKNPRLEMTVVTEFTPYGRTLPTATPEHPVYYIGSNSGFLERGDPIGGLHPPDPNYLGRVLRRALDSASFRAADQTHPPTLALFFHWGSHAAMDFEMRGLFPEKAYRERLERAVLVGGHEFQRMLINQYAYGELPVEAISRMDFLRAQATSDLYFVVVSAYDYDALRQGQRRLVWRTNLTVSAHGVAMVDSLPALILTGAPYFGQRTEGAEILFRRVHRGVVTLGDTEVVASDVPLASPPRK